MARGALLPRPTAGPDLLKASHFALGPDPRLHAGAKHSTTHRDFPAYPQAAPAQPCPPPPRGTLFQQDARWAREERVSETHGAFVQLPVRPRERERERGRERARALALAGQASHVHVRADARPRALLSTASADFGWPELPGRGSEQNPGARLIFHRDSVPPGDRAKLRIPPTTHQALFPLRDACPQLRASRLRRGECVPTPCALHSTQRLSKRAATLPPLRGDSPWMGIAPGSFQGLCSGQKAGMLAWGLARAAK